MKIHEKIIILEMYVSFNKILMESNFWMNANTYIILRLKIE